MYKIILDSSGELTEEMKADEHFVNVPMTLDVNGYTVIDDDTFDQADFLRRVKESPTAPKSACPAPGMYLEQIDSVEENVYLITISGALSGSYNSAVVAKEMYEEEHKESKKNIHVFDGKTTAVGETLIAMKIAACEKAGMAFDEIVKAVENYIAEQHTFFVLETLEVLRKAGRLGLLKERIAHTLRIKPVMGSTSEGNIQQLAQVRGMKNAITKMVDLMLAATKNCSEKVLGISHCNCLDRALKLKEEIEKRAKFKDILIMDTRALNTTYACDGGLIMVV
ncbi:MAG: DegV family protein [Lachnospiraceae bacterium]|nr:DegV family protein [Lachnospiraceae bacterium]